MKSNSAEVAVEALKALQRGQSAYDHAMGVLYLDAPAAAPGDTWEGRGKTMEVLSQAFYDLLTAPENAGSPDGQTRRETESLKKTYEKTKLHQMELGDVFADVEKGDLSRVTGRLREKIHRHASFYKPGALLKAVCLTCNG